MVIKQGRNLDLAFQYGIYLKSLYKTREVRLASQSVAMLQQPPINHGSKVVILLSAVTYGYMLGTV